jgi:hypothetical protein
MLDAAGFRIERIESSRRTDGIDSRNSCRGITEDDLACSGLFVQARRAAT